MRTYLRVLHCKTFRGCYFHKSVTNYVTNKERDKLHDKQGRDKLRDKQGSDKLHDKQGRDKFNNTQGRKETLPTVTAVP